MALVCISLSQLGIQLVSELIHFHESCHSFESFKEFIVHYRIMSWYPLGQFNAAKYSVMPPNVQREFMLRVYLYSQNILCVSTFDSFLWLHHTKNSITLFQVSCHQCGIHHGPPSTRLFLSTSAHHPGISLRNNVVP